MRMKEGRLIEKDACKRRTYFFLTMENKYGWSESQKGVECNAEYEENYKKTEIDTEKRLDQFQAFQKNKSKRKITGNKLSEERKSLIPRELKNFRKG